MRIAIVIVNYNGWQDTIESLESVFRLDYPDFQVIVCDNGSTDDSLTHLKEWAEGRLHSEPAGPDEVARLARPAVVKPVPFRCYECDQLEAATGLEGEVRLVLIDCKANLGFAGGNNVGLRFARASSDPAYLWLLNNDTVVDPQALNCLVSRMLEQPSAGMCGSTLLYYDKPTHVQALGGGHYCCWIGLPWHLGRLKTVQYDFTPQRSERWMNYIVGASMLVSRKFVETVGMMDEAYFLYFEELDWALRGKGRFTLAYAPGSIVYHKVGRSIGTSSLPGRKSYACDYYNIRNRLFFTRRYYPYALPAIYLTLGVAMLSRAMFGKWDRVRMIWQLLIGNEDLVKPVLRGES